MELANIFKFFVLAVVSCFPKMWPETVYQQICQIAFSGKCISVLNPSENTNIYLKKSFWCGNIFTVAIDPLVKCEGIARLDLVYLKTKRGRERGS